MPHRASPVATPQEFTLDKDKATLKKGAVVEAVSVEAGVPTQGHVTISADRLAKRRGMPTVVWVLVAVLAVVALIVLASR